MKKRLAGTAEIAAAVGVSAQAVSNWRTFRQDFPKPLADLRMGPVYDMDAVLRWYAARREARKKHA